MPRKLSKEGEDFNKLRGLGYEFKSPQDEYSYQPDSGSSIGGKQGSQEYGIDSSLDSGGKRGMMEAKNFSGAVSVDKKSSSLDQDSIPKDINADLLAYISERLNNHPELKNRVIKINSEKKGIISVKGVVKSQADKMRVSELIEAIVPNTELRNELEVSTSV